MSGFIFSAAGFILPLALRAHFSQQLQTEFTNIQIILGLDADNKGALGGNVPSAAVWDEHGSRIGQWYQRKSYAANGKSYNMVVENNENGGEQADPYYVMLSNFYNDAICIAAITVSNPKISSTFYGDTGYACGQSWFPSQNKIGSNFEKPKCVWLDGDHTNRINARALSFHINDMAPTADKLLEYQNNLDTLCKSTPRFSFWGNLLPDGVIPFFDPPLEYNQDSQSNGEGADVDPARVIDEPPDRYNKAVYLHQGESLSRRARRRSTTSQGWNHDPSHLIVTDNASDDILEVCEHPNSYGWDIVSTVQKLYCDMEHKILYPLCAQGQIEDNCFCLQDKTIKPKAGLSARDVLAVHGAAKNYTSYAQWEG